MNTKPALDELFEPRLTYPDSAAKARLDSLVGLDDKKARLTKILALLVNPAGLEDWIGKHHKGAVHLKNTVLRRPPLVVLAGDVGSGKTELAETIGDAVARQEKIDITLLPLSLSTRGQGRVGEMTQLLSAAFEYTITEATKLKGQSRARGAVILLVDEADALAQSRESAQMHHEDRAGVNAFMFRQQHAKVFGSLINLCCLALQHREAVELDRVHKDAELERWILTVDKALGLEGKMLPALQFNLQQTVIDIVKERPAVRGFLALVRAKGSVKATATELLDEVEPFLDLPKDASYPTSGRGFADLLRSHKRFMTDIEIEFGHRTGKNRDRNISASWQGSKTAPAAVAARSSSKAAVGRKKATGLPEDQPTLL